jgi:hypothetical protein
MLTHTGSSSVGVTEAIPAQQQQAQERRSNSRRPAPKLLIAYHAGSNVPPADAFVEVEGGDLSQGGFSFYSEELPAVGYIVVKITTGKTVTYGQARISWCRSTLRNGRSAYAVGCEFTKEL